jgi:hypothetical protein
VDAREAAAFEQHLLLHRVGAQHLVHRLGVGSSLRRVFGTWPWSSKSACAM